MGRSLGAILTEEFAGTRVISRDGLDLRDLDYLDVGTPIQPAGVMPVVVNSLAFSSSGDRVRRGCALRAAVLHRA